MSRDVLKCIFIIDSDKSSLGLLSGAEISVQKSSSLPVQVLTRFAIRLRCKCVLVSWCDYRYYPVT